MSTNEPRPVYQIVVEALPDGDGVPPTIRLRRFLKSALRAYGLRCLQVEELLAIAATDQPGEDLGSSGTAR